MIADDGPPTLVLPLPSPRGSSARLVVRENGRERVIAKLPLYLFDLVLVVADEGGVEPLSVALEDVVARLPGRPEPDSVATYVSELDYFDLRLRRYRDERGCVVLSLGLPAGVSGTELPPRDHVKAYMVARRREAQQRGRVQACESRADTTRRTLDDADQALLVGDTKQAEHALARIARDSGSLARSLSRTTRHQLIAKLHETRADLQMQHGNAESSLRETERARRHFVALNDEEALIRLETLSVASLRIAGRNEDALRRARALTSRVRTKRTPAAIAALTATHAPAVYAGVNSEAYCAAHAGLSAAFEAGNGVRIAESYLRLAQATLMRGALDEVESLIERAAAIPETTSSRWLTIWLGRWRLDLAVARGAISGRDLDAIAGSWQLAWQDRNAFQQLLILAAIREIPMDLAVRFGRDAAFRACVAQLHRESIGGTPARLLQRRTTWEQITHLLHQQGNMRLRIPRVG